MVNKNVCEHACVRVRVRVCVCVCVYFRAERFFLNKYCVHVCILCVSDNICGLDKGAEGVCESVQCKLGIGYYARKVTAYVALRGAKVCAARHLDCCGLKNNNKKQK